MWQHGVDFLSVPTVYRPGRNAVVLQFTRQLILSALALFSFVTTRSLFFQFIMCRSLGFLRALIPVFACRRRMCFTLSLDPLRGGLTNLLGSLFGTSFPR